MKKLHFIPLLFIVLGGLLQGCLKDTLTATYTSYEPVYKSKQEVLAAVKGGEARPLRNTGKLVLSGKPLPAPRPAEELPCSRGHRILRRLL